MNNQKYWEERTILKDKLLEKDINKLEKKLLKLFKDTRKEILNELKIIYADIEASEYAKYRIDSLLTSINNALDNLYSNNEKEVNEGLVDIYKEMDKQASIDLNNSFNTVNENLVRETLKTNWSGLSFSERIWEHRRSLAFTIKSELNKGFIRGDSLQDISKIISDKFDTSFSNAMRLVRTESCWIMNEATVNNYKENGIKEYEFMAFLDSKTSKECKRLDGKKFSIEEYQAGVNLPPLHPNCRSCIIPIVEDIKKPIKEAKENIEEINILDELTSKGVKIDIDSFKDIDKKLFNENSKQLNYLIDKYPKVKDYIKKYPFEFKAEVMKDTTNATCRTNLDANRIAIVINSKNFDSYKGLFDRAMDSMIKGWHCPKSEDKLTVGTLTHEFGHAIHNVLMREYNNNNQGFEAFKKRVIATKDTKKRSSLVSNYIKDIVSGFNKEIITIAKEIDPSVDTVISRYGGSSPQEFFAECFTNYECGKPNTLGKAMGIFLERNFK